MTNKPIKEYEDFTGEAGYLIVDSLTNETSGGKLKVPNYKDVTDGYVLTKTSNSGTDEVVWAQAGGSSGGLSPISPTTITPTLENNTYKIVIPGNNAYYIATINGDTHNVEITPPTIGANEMYNIVLFVVSNDAGDKQMTMAYGDYDISPMDDESMYGWVYGLAFTQFVFLGRGFTMKTSAYSGG